MNSHEDRIEQINKDIRIFELDARSHLLIAKIAFANCNTYKKADKESINAGLTALAEARITKKRKVADKIKEKLKKIGKAYCHNTSYEILDQLEAAAEKQRIEVQNDVFRKAAEDISNDPTAALISAVEEYVRCKKQVIYLEERKKEKPVQEKVEPKKQPATTSTQEKYVPLPFQPTDSDIVKQQKLTTYLIEKYSNEINETNVSYYNKIYLDDEDKKIISSLFDKQYNAYYVSLAEEIINNTYTINGIYTKFNKYEKNSKAFIKKKMQDPNILDLLTMAECIAEQLPKELMSSRTETNNNNTFYQNLVNKSGLMQSLEKYNKAYNIYKNYYQKLEPSQQIAVKAKFEMDHLFTFSHTLGIEQFEILSPTQLRDIVNDKVIKLMEENYIYYCKNHSYDKVSAIKKASIFMDINKLALAYIKIKNRQNKYISYSNTNNIEIEEHNKSLSAIQQNFAEAMVQKLTQEEKKNKTKEELLKYVCEEYLKEKPLFEIHTNDTEIEESTQTNVVKETHGKQTYTYTINGNVETTTNAAIAARYDAQHRFFGMSKLLQTTNKINGNWSKFEELWKKAAQVTNENEIEEVANELNSMFRR